MSRADSPQTPHRPETTDQTPSQLAPSTTVQDGPFGLLPHPCVQSLSVPAQIYPVFRRTKPPRLAWWTGVESPEARSGYAAHERPSERDTNTQQAEAN